MASKKVTIKQIKNLQYTDVKKMTKKELHEFLKVASPAVDIRMQRLKKHKLITPAYKYMEEHGKIKVSTHQTRAQMIAELTEAKKFLNKVTSTVKGSRAYIRTMKEVLGIPKNARLSETDLKAIWDMVVKIKESFPGITSDVIQQTVTDKYIELKGKRISKKKKKELAKDIMNDRVMHDMLKDKKDLEEMTKSEYILYKSMLEVQKRYEREQSESKPEFFRFTK